MPMSNADNPAAVPVWELAGEDVTEHVEDPTDVPKPAKKGAKAAAKADEPAPAPELAKAFTSGNAEVHNLVAKREIASSNQDEAAIAAVDAELAALGYRI